MTDGVFKKKILSFDPGQWSLVVVWCVFFTFTASVALFVQLWFLPTFLPGGTSGQGLLLSTDSISYHKLATAMAEQIHQHGWSEWVLSPKGWFMVGFTAALYAITTPEPWIMIPLNAAAHATCGVALVKITLCFTTNKQTAFFAALPYILFPSASFWYTQLLKDGFFNMGLLMFLAGWTCLIRGFSLENKWSRSFASAASILAGFALLGIVRPYMISVGNAATFFVVIIALLAVTNRFISKDVSPALSGLRFLSVLAIFGLQLTYPSLIVQTGGASEQTITINNRSNYAQDTWEAVGLAPNIIDHKLQIIAGTRQAFIQGRPDALSTMDRDVRFNNPGDILIYIPRALQIVFLAPFPDMWMGSGSTPATTIMRRVSMAEMLANYGLMLGIPIALWAWRRKAEMWAIIAFCSSVMLVYGVSSPNVGTLYRVRYGYLMVFLSLGVLGWRRLRRRE